MFPIKKKRLLIKGVFGIGISLRYIIDFQPKKKKHFACENFLSQIFAATMSYTISAPCSPPVDTLLSSYHSFIIE